MRVLGIDPGVAATGYAVVERAGGKLSAVTFGVVRTSPEVSMGARLMSLRRDLLALIDEQAPDVVALERLFFSANVKTATAVGQASGIVLAAAAEARLEVGDYTPNEVKQSVVGYGGASKRQVQVMVGALLGLREPPRPPDAADACALAICHLNRLGLRRAIDSAAGGDRREMP